MECNICTSTVSFIAIWRCAICCLKAKKSKSPTLGWRALCWREKMRISTFHSIPTPMGEANKSTGNSTKSFTLTKSALLQFQLFCALLCLCKCKHFVLCCACANVNILCFVVLVQIQTFSFLCVVVFVPMSMQTDQSNKWRQRQSRAARRRRRATSTRLPLCSGASPAAASRTPTNRRRPPRWRLCAASARRCRLRSTPACRR